MRQHPTIDLALSLTPAAWFVVAQTPGDWSLIERLLQPGNVAASTLLVMIVMAFVKGWIVPGWQYRALREDREKWNATALDAFRTLGKATDTGREAVRTVRVLTDAGSNSTGGNTDPAGQQQAERDEGHPNR